MPSAAPRAMFKGTLGEQHLRRHGPRPVAHREHLLDVSSHRSHIPVHRLVPRAATCFLPSMMAHQGLMCSCVVVFLPHGYRAVRPCARMKSELAGARNTISTILFGVTQQEPTWFGRVRGVCDKCAKITCEESDFFRIPKLAVRSGLARQHMLFTKRSRNMYV